MQIREVEIYEAVGSTDMIEFNVKVNDRLKLGYVFYGNPFIIGGAVVQPMVKYKAVKETVQDKLKKAE